jgi:hypothetical protein
MSCQIFISLRFAEAGNEATALKSALEARGISTFLCAVLPGDDIATEIVNALHDCKLAIIMGTKTYGKDTGAGFSTFEELRFIHKKKPFFLIKMCEQFEERETIFRLDSSVSYFQWLPGRPMAGDLVALVLERLASVASRTTPSIKFTYSNGGVYEGEMKDEKRIGHGKMIYAEGDVYEGEWKNDERNGHGKIVYANGNLYEGDWKDDKRTGHGKSTYTSGNVYEGEFKDGKKHGKGKSIADGIVYEGDFKDEKKNGKGKTTWPNGNVYEGEMKDDKRTGKGKMTYASGNVYEGHWKDGKKDGHGKMTSASGEVHDGEWKNDQKV